MTSLDPNATLPCRTSSARRRHLARGEVCPACDTAAETAVLCARCGIDGRPTLAAYVQQLEGELAATQARLVDAEARLAKVADWVAMSIELDQLRAALAETGRAA